MAVQIQVRRDTAANWTSANPTLAQGEIGLETDTGKLKIGTGVTAWNSISYFVGNIAGTTLDAIGDVTITSVQNGDFLRYNGSASAWINDPVNLSTDTVGDYVQSLVAGTGVSLANNSGEGSTPTIAIGQAVGTSSSVQFAAVTAPLIGNASTASALQTPRTVQLSGDVSGSASFDGSANINISTVVNTASVALDELYGVSLVAPVEEYQVLQHNGTVWTNDYPDTVSYVRNADSVTLTPGMVVYIFGGNGDHATVKRADNSSDTTSSKTLGVVAATITAGNNGPVVTRGYVDSIDLSTGYTEGDVLWLGKTGAFTTTKPSAPDHLVYIGVVVRATNNGIVYAACQNGYELEELHNVKINGVTDGQFLRYNSASTVWVNDTINLGTDTAGDYVQSLVAGTGLTITENSGEGSTPTLNIGQAVGTTASVLFARVETTGDVVIGGNFTVNGTTTTLNTEHMTVEDQFITLNSGATGTPTLSAGIEVERGDLANVFLHWNESTDKWETTNDGSTYSVIATNGNIALGTDTTGNYVSGVSASTGVTVNHTPGEGSTATISIGQDVSQSASVTFAKVTADLTGNVTGNVTGDITGNADTATTLETARTISLSGDVSGSVSFDGSQNVDITATIQPNSVALGTDTSGDYVSSLVAGTGVSLTNNSGEGATPAVAIGQDVSTSASVQFAAVTAPVVGNASTASALQTARTISLSGDVSGSVSFDGAADASITATIQPNSVALGTDTTGNYLADVTASTGVTISHTAGEGSTATFSIGQPVGTTDSVVFDSVTVGNTGIYFEGSTDDSFETQLNAYEPTSDNQILLPNASGTVALNGSIALGTDTTGNYMSNVSAGAGISVSHTPAEGSTATVSLNAELKDISDVTITGGASYSIGDTGPAGGIIFITPSTSGNTTGKYFEVAPSASPDVQRAWDFLAGTTRNPITGADGTAIGTGEQNTLDILAAGFTTASVSAAAYAAGYTYGGFSDWFLPSVDELHQIFVNSAAIGDLGSLDYWSSTESPDSGGPYQVGDLAYNESLAYGPGSSPKFVNSFEVRPVRSFAVPNTASSGDFLKWNGTGWVNDDIDLGADTTGIYVADIIAGTGVVITNGSSESASPTIAIGQAVGTSASVTFANVTADIVGNVTGNATTVTNGVYTTSSINALADVDTASASPTNGQFLKWNGTNWVPDSVPTINALDDIGDVSAASPSSGDFLKWNGSAWINDPVNLGTDTTGNYMSDLTQGTGVTITHTPGEGSNATIAIGQAVGTSASVTFAKVTAPVTGNLTGNADTATALATSRTIELTGDVTGSASFNGSANASISATIAPNSVALGTDTTGNYVNDITAGTGVTVTHTPSEGSSPTVAIGQNVGTSASVTFAQVETTGSMIIGQNLYVSGSVVTQNQTSLQIDDPFIYLASSGSVAYTDFGIAGNYNDGTYRHGGIFRDSTDGKWKFFDGYTPEPTDPIDTGHASYSAAPVVAKYFESTIATGTAPFTVSSTTAVTNLNADYLDGQHGSYYAPLASPTFTGTVTLPTGTVTSGMILDGTIVNGDINASAAIAHSKLANATAGQVLLGTTTTGVVTATTISGDITITGAGVTAIGSGVIVNADINASAAIALSKLASGTSGQIVVANASGVPTYTTISGDITVNGSGVATIAANSVALGTDTTGNYVSSLVAGTGVTLSNNTGESATPTVAIGQDVGTTSSVTFGTVTSSGLLSLTASSGDEGGELQLAKPQTNTTLAGAVTIDVYQNKLRIFENGGTNRGVYIDLTSASATAGSNLLSSAGATTLDGLSDVTAPTPSSGDFLKYNGTAWVNASGVVTTADTGTVTNTMLAGSIADTKLSTISTAGKVSNSATTATSANTASAIVARDASGNFTAGTITATAIATATTFIGTTSVALNRSSANLALTGISSVALPGSTSGTVTLQPAAAAGTTTITLPATTGTLVTTGDTGTVTSTMIADGTIVNADINASAAIALSKLASGTSGQIIVANSSGVPTWVSESGDISISDTGVTAIKSSVALSGAPTAATATAGTNTTQIATTAFTTTAVRDSLVRLYMEVM